MKYEKQLKAYNERYENDADFRSLADSDPVKALAEAGISDTEDFIKSVQEYMKQNKQMSDSETGEIHGGTPPELNTSMNTLGVNLDDIFNLSYEELRARFRIG